MHASLQKIIGKNSITLQTKLFSESYTNFVKYISVLGYRSPYKELYFPVYVKEFLLFMELQGITNFESIRSQDIQQYKVYLYQRPHKYNGQRLAKKTIGEHFYSLGLFYDYLFNIDLIKEFPYFFNKFKFGNQAERLVLSKKEIKELYLHSKNHLELAILTLAYGCGLRRSEIFHLNMNDLFLDKGLLVVRAGKGGKNRVVPLSNSNKQYLLKYICEERSEILRGRNTRNTQALLINSQGNRLTGERANQILKNIAERCHETFQGKGITLHCLRHSIATHLIENDAGIEFVKDFLGHSEINTTNIYIIKRKQKNSQQRKII